MDPAGGTAPTAPNTFIAFLAQLEDGALQGHLTDQLKEVVGAMHRQARDIGGKPTGAIALKITLKLDGGLFEVVAKTDAKLPVPPRQRSVLYRTGEDLLSPNNPRQIALPFGDMKDVSATAAADVRIVR